jgi:hypothetical protein
MMLAAGAGSFYGRVRNGLGLVLPRSAPGAKYSRLTAKWIENMYANRIDCRPAGGYSATAQTPQSACCAPSETAFSDSASVQESAHIAEVGARQDQHGCTHVCKHQVFNHTYKITDTEDSKHVCKPTIKRLSLQTAATIGNPGRHQVPAIGDADQSGGRTDLGRRKLNRKPSHHASVAPRDTDHRSSAAIG